MRTARATACGPSPARACGTRPWLDAGPDGYEGRDHIGVLRRAGAPWFARPGPEDRAHT
ncbi:hypothetical protein [Streptomyces marianii]|uniref:hypothetical protein n=1 Tax=Streptomyces marianii TaxID=1817406 RepID=UPI001486D65D|nr:hypothetical protein [Streptomyces marianii]